VGPGGGVGSDIRREGGGDSSGAWPRPRIGAGHGGTEGEILGLRTSRRVGGVVGVWAEGGVGWL